MKEVLAICLNGAEGMLTPALKNVERIAAQVILHSYSLKIQDKHSTLNTRLCEKETSLKNYASKQLTGDLKDGLEGKVADTANQDLESTARKLTLHNPIVNKQ